MERKDWSNEECFLAVWGYDRLDLGDYKTKRSIYEEIAKATGRTLKSVEFKIQNVSACDPRPWDMKPVGEASNTQKSLREIFNWYWADRLAARAYLRSSKFNSVDETLGQSKIHSESIFIEEGEQGVTKIKTRKRSEKLVKEGRKHYSDADGFMSCKACGYKTPKSVGKEIVQLHHTKPICEFDTGGQKIKLGDALKLLLPLCPNCHLIAHSPKFPKPPLELGEIKALLTKE